MAVTLLASLSTIFLFIFCRDELSFVSRTVMGVICLAPECCKALGISSTVLFFLTGTYHLSPTQTEIQ